MKKEIFKQNTEEYNIINIIDNSGNKKPLRFKSVTGKPIIIQIKKPRSEVMSNKDDIVRGTEQFYTSKRIEPIDMEKNQTNQC